MIDDKVGTTGALTISLNGEVVRKIKNLVVTTGKQLVAANLKGSVVAPITHMAIGTSDTATAANQTTLIAELDRNALAVSGGTVNGQTVSYSATWGQNDGTGALREAGLFTAPSGGIMLARTVFDVVNKGDKDTITIAWDVTIS